MRRMKELDDRGVTTIIVVLIASFLMLAGAFVFDGGRAYIGQREAQNSADAAALAMAMDCAKGPSGCCESGADATASNYKRSLTERSSITDEDVVIADTYCDEIDGLCKATMQQSIGFRFAPGGGDVTRSGTAKWGTIGSMISPTPLTISACEYSPAILAATTDIYLHMGGTLRHRLAARASPAVRPVDSDGSPTPPARSRRPLGARSPVNRATVATNRVSFPC